VFGRTLNFTQLQIPPIATWLESGPIAVNADANYNNKIHYYKRRFSY